MGCESIPHFVEVSIKVNVITPFIKVILFLKAVEDQALNICPA